VGKAAVGTSPRVMSRVAAVGSWRVSVSGNRSSTSASSLTDGAGSEKPRSPLQTVVSPRTPRTTNNEAQPVREARSPARSPSSPRRNGVPLQKPPQRRMPSPLRGQAGTPPTPAPYLRRQPSPTGALSMLSRCSVPGKLAPQPVVTVSPAAAEHSSNLTGGTGESH